MSLSLPQVVLHGREIHVWIVPLDDAIEPYGAILAATLSPDEAARAARFHFRTHRRRFIAARGSLRLILGLYTGSRPERLVFHYGSRGKPWLASNPDLHMNLSHSDELALVAVTRLGDIGIDVERVRPLSGMENIAGRFFASGEYQRLLALPATERTAAFFRCWTRKEAYVKALGAGIGLGLDRFEVSFEPDRPARMLTNELADWCLVQVDPTPAFVGALAIRGMPVSLRYHHWPSSPHVNPRQPRRTPPEEDTLR